MLADKHIVLGVTGGISVYKMCTAVRLLKKAGAQVRVLMTRAATEFVTPLTFSTLSQEEVTVSLWPADPHGSTDRGVKHIDLGLWADAMLVAPATANTIAHLAHGAAEDVITSTVLALRAPLVIAPAMDVDMWEHPATQANIALLKERGHFIIPPESGELASGLTGAGRLPEPDVIVAYLNDVLERTPRDLTGRRILITAGPTHEPIDPVRFIGNRSSGKMGFALANAAALRGADVTLVAGPVALGTPKNVRRIDVETAQQMHDAVMDELPRHTVLIMAAAVADYTPVQVAEHKIKKLGSHAHGISLELRTTLDILHDVAERKTEQTVIGFALETANELEHAKQKLEKKKLDLIVLNSPNDPGAGFGTDTNVVTLITREGNVTKLPRMPKFDVACAILDRLR
ncbi:MAG: bifunctional phosphopantothenoylcysteine decarboxylase/phosphopantothenate--cysteine ligase CoaBC [Bacteroidetes bacterium]|nr:MAG: bifunctional phosphopantothenoylcysteine decarboxylase/phosphopantothenate--cysteine ligase CoaBC [Bacteroidota bacterium]